MPPVPGAVPVPVCWEGTPVSEPEPGADPVELPVGAPEMPVSDPVPDEALPGTPDTDSAGMPVDSWYMESAGVGFCGGLVLLVQFSAVLFPVGKLNEVSSPLPGSYSVPEGPGISSVECPLAMGKLNDVASLAPGSMLVPDWLGGAPVDLSLAVGKLKDVASPFPGSVLVPVWLVWSPVECPLAVGKPNEVPLPAPGSVWDPDALGGLPAECPLAVGKLKYVEPSVPGSVLDPGRLGWPPVGFPLAAGKLNDVSWLPEDTPVGLLAEMEGKFPGPVGTLVELLIGKLKERDPKPVGAGPPGPDSG